MSTTLYILAASANSHGPVTLVNEAKLDSVTVKALDPMKGETRTPEFMAKNPYHCCPSLEVDSTMLWESNTVLRVLCDKFELKQWYPTDLLKRAKVDQFLDFRQSAYYPKLAQATYVHLNFGMPFFDKAEEQVRELLEGIAKNYLGAGKFLLDNETPTIADLSFRPTLKFLQAIPTGYTLPAAIQAYAERFDKAVPGYLEASKPLDGYLGYLASQRKESEQKEKDAVTLYYWNGRGAMEPSRSMMAVAGKFPGAGYTDNRDSNPAAIPGLWNCGRLPAAAMNGEYFGQSAAIHRFVARINGLAGKDDFEAARIDAISETTKELKDAYYKLASYPGPHAEKDEKKREELLTTWFDTEAPKGLEEREKRQLRWWLQNLEGVVGDDGFAVGGKVSMADAIIYNVLGEFDAQSDNPDASGPFGNKARTDKVLADYPKVAKVVETFRAQPGMKKWLETRGKQNF